MRIFFAGVLRGGVPFHDYSCLVSLKHADKVIAVMAAYLFEILHWLTDLLYSSVIVNRLADFKEKTYDKLKLPV